MWMKCAIAGRLYAARNRSVTACLSRATGMAPDADRPPGGRGSLCDLEAGGLCEFDHAFEAGAAGGFFGFLAVVVRFQRDVAVEAARLEGCKLAGIVYGAFADDGPFGRQLT